MEANKILSAALIDVIFDGRNKEYGAYDLRKTNSTRTKAALSITIAVVALTLCGVTMANTFKKNEPRYKVTPGIELTKIDEKIPEKLPEPVKKPEVEQVQTKTFTPPEIVPDPDFDKPLPSIDDLDSFKIDLEDKKGKPDIFTVDKPGEPGDGKGIIPPKDDPESDEPVVHVQVPAKFIGNWEKFLLKNLDADVPVNNGAGPGRYSVVIQFVVDKEGNVSEIKPLTSHGYGVEEEAVRVLKKATKWEPAIQNGYNVKAYHKQVITFSVEE